MDFWRIDKRQVNTSHLHAKNYARTRDQGGVNVENDLAKSEYMRVWRERETRELDGTPTGLAGDDAKVLKEKTTL